MRQVTAPMANSERSTASINSVGPASSKHAATVSPACFALAGGHSAPCCSFVFLDRSHLALRFAYHACRNGRIGFWIDQNQRAGSAIVTIKIDCDWPQQMQRDCADIVHA
jgi:hypothetical protein